MRLIRAASFLFPVAFCLCAPPPDLKFAAASIRRSEPGSTLGTIYPAPGHQRYVGTCVSLKLMMTVAYRVNYQQVSGPSWISDDLFDVNATAEKPSSTEELRVMLRNMVVDRFHLKMHTESRMKQVYVMSVDKSGLKMTPSEGKGDPEVAEPAIGTLTGHFTPMHYFAWLLGLFVDRPIVDQTGLKDVYDFTLTWNADLTPDAQADSAPGLPEALRRQMGLRLDARKDALDVMVIDHVEHPDPN